MTYTVLDAVKYLASRCDGASTWDGSGFNKFDTDFGHSLASRPSEWGLTENQEKAARKMLRKYGGQLAQAGIDVNSLQGCAVAPRQARFTPSSHRMWLESDHFVIQLVGRRVPSEILSGVRVLPGRRYDSDRKVNVVPVRAVVETTAFCRRHGIEIDAACRAQMEALVARKRDEERRQELALAASEATDADIELPIKSLFPYQRAGVAYVADRRRTFLADEMGLGKTRQALAALMVESAFPALVVCPKSLVLGWRDEAAQVAPSLKVETCSGSSLIREGADVYVINYDVVEKRKDAFLSQDLQALVLDESHYVKNYKAKRTKTIEEIADAIPEDGMIVCISGTPLVNRPAELITQLKIMRRLDDLGGFQHYWAYYCGYDQRGAQNLIQLNEALRRNCMVRRLKRDVLTELPPKLWAHVPMELSNMPEYRQAEQDFLSWLYEHTDEDGKIASAMRAEALVRMGVLRRLASEGKMQSVTEWTKFFLDTDGKLVLFAEHQRVQRELYASLGQYNPRRIASDMDNEQRQQAVKDFQTDDAVRVIVCSMRAAGVGLTLTAASNVAFVELAWTPAAMDQAADRCHRIGQHDSVTAWQLIAPDTIDEYMLDLIDQKREIVGQVLDGQADAQATEHSVQDEVLDKLLERRST